MHEVPELGDTGEREIGACAGCGRYGNWLKDDVSIWCGRCGGAGDPIELSIKRFDRAYKRALRLRRGVMRYVRSTERPIRGEWVSRHVGIASAILMVVVLALVAVLVYITGWLIVNYP